MLPFRSPGQLFGGARSAPGEAATEAARVESRGSTVSLAHAARAASQERAKFAEAAAARIGDFTFEDVGEVLLLARRLADEAYRQALGDLAEAQTEQAQQEALAALAPAYAALESAANAHREFISAETKLAGATGASISGRHEDARSLYVQSGAHMESSASSLERSAQKIEGIPHLPAVIAAVAVVDRVINRLNEARDVAAETLSARFRAFAKSMHGLASRVTAIPDRAEQLLEQGAATSRSRAVFAAVAELVGAYRPLVQRCAQDPARNAHSTARARAWELVALVPAEENTQAQGQAEIPSRPKPRR